MTNNEPRGPVGILGDEKDDFDVGKKLVARTSGVFDADGIDYSTVKLQWLRDGEEIPSATDKTYTVKAEDRRSFLSVRYTYTDKSGNEESVTSKTTRRVPETKYDTLSVLYEYLLDRKPDHAGLVFWANVLEKYEAKNIDYPLATVIRDFMSSPGYKKETQS